MPNTILKKPAKSLNINILSCKRMKIVENNAKCGETIIFDHKFCLKT